MGQFLLRHFFLLTILFVIGACDANPFGDADPLADQPDAIKNGQSPKKPEPEKPRPLPEEVLTVDHSDFYTFREGVEQEITITSRNFFEDSTYQLEVVNLNDFKDAVVTTLPGDTKSQQVATLKFRWKPPVGFVIQDRMVYPLDIKAFTTNGVNTYIRTKSIPLHVYNEKFAMPEIISITKVPTILKEKQAPQFFEVRVKDIDAKDTDGLRPSLQFLAKNIGSLNLAPFVKVQKVTFADPAQNLWDFRVEIHLNGLELTSHQTTGYFDVYAISAHGVESNPRGQQVAVRTSVAAPVTSWSSAIEFKVGQTHRFSFTVLDPKGEGLLRAQFETQCSALPGAPDCSCQSVTGSFGNVGSSSLCTILWSVPATESPRAEKFTVTATNESPVSGDNEQKTATFNGTINLVQ